mmetsp:Transcript_60852/g.162906  ORF Transcript_60852/g.162906 Transcript_60852/m.162906 type:complete len:244 (-) Transcript_60852:186-917(-)
MFFFSLLSDISELSIGYLGWKSPDSLSCRWSMSSLFFFFFFLGGSFSGSIPDFAMTRMCPWWKLMSADASEAQDDELSPEPTPAPRMHTGAPADMSAVKRNLSLTAAVCREAWPFRPSRAFRSSGSLRTLCGIDFPGPTDFTAGCVFAARRPAKEASSTEILVGRQKAVGKPALCAFVSCLREYSFLLFTWYQSRFGSASGSAESRLGEPLSSSISSPKTLRLTNCTWGPRAGLMSVISPKSG